MILNCLKTQKRKKLKRKKSPILILTARNPYRDIEEKGSEEAPYFIPFSIIDFATSKMNTATAAIPAAYPIARAN